MNEIEAPRRAREMPLFGEHHEMLKLFQVHSPPPCRRHSINHK